MKILQALGNSIYRFLQLTLLVILSGMIIIGLMQVLFRYIFKTPLPWAEELLRYLFIWMTLLGGAVAVRSKGQIAMNLLVNRLPDNIKIMINVIVALISLFILSYLAATGYNMAMLNAGQNSDALGIPMSYPYLAIPVGAILMIFFLIEGVIVDIHGWAKRKQYQACHSPGGNKT